MRNKFTIAFLSITILIFSITSSFAFEVEEETDYIWLQEEILKASTNNAKEPNLNSRNIVAYDRTSKKVLYGKNENQKVPMASTTKIMTAIILIESLNNENLLLNTEVEVCKQAAAIGGSRLGLKSGDKISVNDLLYGLMLCSRK